jgi:hypothetical protein
MPPQEIFKIWVSEIAFSAFWEHILKKIPASQNKALMVKFVINCMLNIQTQHKFKYAHQQILFFELLFDVKLIYSIQVLGPWLWGNRPFFFFSGGQRKGPSGANAPPVHGIKKCLVRMLKGKKLLFLNRMLLVS